MLKKRPGEENNSSIKAAWRPQPFPRQISWWLLFFPSPPPPYSPHFLWRIGLVVFWLWKGNHRTAGAWIFQMTNVAHAYFWHIWLPQGNKTLLMQGDHLLSVAGVSEQAGSVHTHTQWRYTQAQRDAHVHTRAGRQVGTFTHSGGRAYTARHMHTHM